MARFGCVVLQNRPYDELKRDWADVEAAGFHTLWVADHLMTFPRMGVLLEAWTTLAAAAATTSRIRIGTLVTNITYRNPMLVAKEAITLDHISNGRLTIGVGASGTRRGDGEVAGIEDWSVAERADRLESFVEILDLVLREDTESYSTPHYGTVGFGRGPWPVQTPRPPLVVAAQGPRTLGVAARYADTWNALAGFGRMGDDLLAFLKSCNAELDDLAEGFGRSPSDIRRSLLVQDSGFEWWASPAALDDFIGSVSSTGVQDFDFYYPPYAEAEDGITPEGFLELLAGAIARHSG